MLWRRVFSWMFFIIAYFACVMVFQPATRLEYVGVLLYALFAKFIVSLLLRISLGFSLTSFLAFGLFFTFSMVSYVMPSIFTNATMVLLLYFISYVMAFIWLRWFYPRSFSDSGNDRHSTTYSGGAKHRC